MVLLKALNLPTVTPYVLSFLAEQGVATVEDFLVQDLQNLLAVAGEGLVSTELQQAVTDVLSYLESVQETWSNGLSIFQQVRQFLPINCKSIDLLLHGGLLEGTVTELVGASSTGKSQICMQAAASMAYRYPSSVVYVDTGRTFSAQRVAHMLGSILDCQYDILEKQDLKSAMKSIRRVGIFDIFSMLSFLHTLLECLRSRSRTADDLSQLRLLIIDSASAVIAPVLGGSHTRGLYCLHHGPFNPVAVILPWVLISAELVELHNMFPHVNLNGKPEHRSHFNG